MSRRGFCSSSTKHAPRANRGACRGAVADAAGGLSRDVRTQRANRARPAPPRCRREVQVGPLLCIVPRLSRDTTGYLRTLQRTAVSRLLLVRCSLRALRAAAALFDDCHVAVTASLTFPRLPVAKRTAPPRPAAQ